MTVSSIYSTSKMILHWIRGNSMLVFSHLRNTNGDAFFLQWPFFNMAVFWSVGSEQFWLSRKGCGKQKAGWTREKEEREAPSWDSSKARFAVRLHQQAADVQNVVMTAMMTNESLGKFITFSFNLTFPQQRESVGDTRTAEAAEC